MKRILFFIVAALTFIGCSTSDDNDISFDNIDDFYKNQKVYYDGIYYIPYIKNDYAYKFSENGDLIWKNKIQYPPTTVSESYGEKVDLEYKNTPFICLFKKNYALYFTPSTLVTSSTVRYTYLDIYSSNGTLIKRTKYDTNMTLYSWNNDAILMIKDNNEKSWLSASGEEIDFPYKGDLIFYTTYSPINNIGYVTYSPNQFVIVNFQKGNSSDILHNFIIKNYGIDYKLKIVDVKVDNLNVFAHININTKNNEKYDITIKINAETFSCENT